eukprot:6554368-Prymnesium_polylepis.4
MFHTTLATFLLATRTEPFHATGRVPRRQWTVSKSVSMGRGFGSGRTVVAFEVRGRWPTQCAAVKSFQLTSHDAPREPRGWPAHSPACAARTVCTAVAEARGARCTATPQADPPRHPCP